MSKNIGFVFPAFGCDYCGKEKNFLEENIGSIKNYLERALSVTGYRNMCDDEFLNGSHGDELVAQYATYIYSCILSDYLKECGVKAAYSAGYSMGIYACLYHADSITFETGLRLIKKAFDLITESTAGSQYGMGAIIGLGFNDIIGVINECCCDVEIINVNSENSYVISGQYYEVKKVVEASRLEGALSTRLLPIQSCYHSQVLAGASQKFEGFIESSVTIQKAHIPIVSNIDQTLIQDRDAIKSELIRNLNMKINWYETMKKLIGLDVKEFVECGPGVSLFKISKFIEGDFKVYTVKNLPRYLAKISPVLHETKVLSNNPLNNRYFLNNPCGT